MPDSQDCIQILRIVYRCYSIGGNPQPSSFKPIRIRTQYYTILRPISSMTQVLRKVMLYNAAEGAWLTYLSGDHRVLEQRDVDVKAITVSHEKYNMLIPLRM